MSKTVTADELPKVAKEFLDFLSTRVSQSSATIIGLSGDLGAGKTTFTQAIARELGVAETVASPTFVIEKVYLLPKDAPFQRLIHIDAYRLSDGEDLRSLGWDEISTDPHNMIIVEWPEHVRDLGSAFVAVSLGHVDEHTRTITW